MIPQLIACENLVKHALDTLTQKLRVADPTQLHHVVLTGGSTGMSITRKLAEVAQNVPAQTWANTHFWWGDERFVETDSPDRNDREIESTLGDYFIGSNIHRVTAANQILSAQESADEYARALLDYGSDGLPPRFTLVFLGVGPDGHIASLFPGRPELTSHAIALPVRNSPKPPPIRVTLCYPTLNNSNCTLLLIGGESKQEALDLIMCGDGSVERTPARGIAALELYALSDLLVTV